MDTSLLKLLNNKKVSTIILHNNINVDTETLCKYNVAFDCNGYTIQSNIKNGNILIFKKGAELYDFRLDNDIKPTENTCITAIHLYGDEIAENSLKNLYVENCNIPICIHSTKLQISGIIDISKCICGIHLYSSQLELSPFEQTQFINTSESYYHPTITAHEDSEVIGGDRFTMIEVNSRKQYYLNAKNALKPE